MKRILNMEYAGLQGAYWIISCPIVTYASAFLLDRHYSNGDIGMILAAANIIAVILQPLMADVADRSKHVSLFGVIKLTCLFMMGLTGGLFLSREKSLGLTLIFAAIASLFIALQPMLNSLVFKLEESGSEMNFGACRAFGSIVYAVVCPLLGMLVGSMGTGILPVACMGSILLFFGLLVLNNYHFKSACRKKEKSTELKREEKEDAAEEINLIQFASRNKMFFLLTVGVMCVFYTNSTLNNFMLQIITPLGGTSEDLGLVFGLLAALEVPVLMCFNRIRHYASCQTLLKIASLSFLVKIGVTWMADSMAAIYLSQLLQMVSFAIFLPAMVEFVHQIMRKGEAVKGQALYMAMVTAASVMASFMGGYLLDYSGAKLLLLVSTLFTAVGTIIVFLTVDRLKA